MYRLELRQNDEFICAYHSFAENNQKKLAKERALVHLANQTRLALRTFGVTDPNQVSVTLTPSDEKTPVPFPEGKAVMINAFNDPQYIFKPPKSLLLGKKK